MLIITVVFAAALLGWAVFVFNRLVRARNLVRNGFADIDVQLQRRHDLIPALVDTVRAYSEHEQQLLEDVTRLRSAAVKAEGGSASRMSGTEAALVDGLGRLLAVAEDYPELKASENFQQLTAELVATEDVLSHARRFYNGAVRDLNTAIERFPDLLIARLAGFDKAEFFSAGIEARSAPVIARLMASESE